MSGKKLPKSELVPTHTFPTTPVNTELAQIINAIGGQGGKISYNGSTGELKGSVIKDGFAYSVEKKHVGMGSVQTTTATPIGNSKEERKQQVIEFAKAHPKASQTTLGNMTGVSQGTVSTYIREAKKDGLL